MNDSTFQKETLRIQAAQARSLNVIASALERIVQLQEIDINAWMNRALKRTGDFKRYCQSEKLNLNDPVSLEIFKNYILDHGGNLEDCE